MERELIQRGVKPEVAVKSVKEKSAEFIQVKIEVVDWLVENKDKRVNKSPTGYLVSSIREEYGLPDGFESKATRAQKEEAKRTIAQQEVEAAREKEKQKRRNAAIHKKVLAYWGGLSPVQQEELDATALREADPEAATEYCEQEAKGYDWAKSTFRICIRDPYIRKLLGLQEVLKSE